MWAMWCVNVGGIGGWVWAKLVSGMGGSERRCPRKRGEGWGGFMPEGSRGWGEVLRGWNVVNYGYESD